jgi:hypothetical protein
LIVLVAVVYAPSLGGGFVFDDRLLILDNEIIPLPPWDLPSLLGPTAGARIAYRPLRTLSYMIDYQMGGGFHPFVFHLSNLAYHAATVLAVHALARPRSARRSARSSQRLSRCTPGTEAVTTSPVGATSCARSLRVVLALRASGWLLDRRAGKGHTAGPLAATLVSGLAALAAKRRPRSCCRSWRLRCSPWCTRGAIHPPA